MVKTNVPFSKKLILNKFLLNYLGFDEFNEISKYFSDPVYEGVNPEGQSKLFDLYWNRMEIISEKKITREVFAEYDFNVLSYLDEINKLRDEPITLKYFQYFSLIFVEIYLDNLFADRDNLLNQLNTNINSENEKLNIDFSPYTEKDLNKLAIWNATGSGKTLIMHMNYLQIKKYLKKYGVHFDGTYILLTPSESLSKQHLEEYKTSGIKAGSFNKNASHLFSRPEDIQVIENTKLSETEGEKTVSVQRFGDNNILFVDEGHRGSSGDSWYSFRNRLCDNGFSFEYSATFSQAVQTSTKKDLEEEYAKCILFDYSYKHFYEDGYGKDYRILNLSESIESNNQSIYLTAALLSFYQQKKVFFDKNELYKEYNIENPLMVFVGGKVTATTKNKTDIIEIISFLNEFISNPTRKIDEIDQIIRQDSPLLDVEGKDLFSTRFDYLLMKDLSAEEIYDEILDLIFHTKHHGQLLHADNLKGIDGEIRLSIGENHPFGVINVGKDKDLLQLISNEGIQTDNVDFADSLFNNINEKESTINILIGSKKFAEGWNSWRVSTMGLMNVGKKEGSQIIQLFGRGVRLKGRNFSLKRSSKFHQDFKHENKLESEELKFLALLETLNIFGLYADYMQQFKSYLSSEGLNPENEIFNITIPVSKSSYPKGRLKTLKIRDGLDFKKDGPQPSFAREISKPVVLDTYGKIQFESSIENKSERKKIKNLGVLTGKHFFGMDFEYIYSELLKYKKQKKYWNVVFSLSDIKLKLNDTSWYELFIPESELEIKSIKDFQRFTRIGLSLVKKHLDKVYFISKNEFESPLREYVLLEDENPNFIDKYDITINKSESHLDMKKLFEKVESLIKDSSVSLINNNINNKVDAKYISISLYNPLFHTEKGLTDIQMLPAALVDSEWDFVLDLTNYVKSNSKKFENTEMYLIRNLSRKGIGFFEEYGFYPDFILWYFNGDKEYISFIEPHGMYYEDLNGSKVGLATEIKKLEKEIPLTGTIRPVLESFILSPTPFIGLNSNSKYTKKELNNKNIIFMEDTNYIEQIFDVLE